MEGWPPIFMVMPLSQVLSKSYAVVACSCFGDKTILAQNGLTPTSYMTPMIIPRFGQECSQLYQWCFVTYGWCFAAIDWPVLFLTALGPSLDSQNAQQQRRYGWQCMVCKSKRIEESTRRHILVLQVNSFGYHTVRVDRSEGKEGQYCSSSTRE